MYLDKIEGFDKVMYDVIEMCWYSRSVCDMLH